MTLAISHYPNPNLEHFGHTVAHWQQNIAKLWLTLRAARSGKASLAAYQCQPPSIDPGIGRTGWDLDPSSDCHPISFVDLKRCLEVMRMNNIHHHNHLHHSKERDIATSSLVLQTGDSWCGSLGRAGQNFSSVSWLDLVSIDFVSMVKH